MNNADFWFPWFPAIYQANTLELTLEQDGMYRRLIDHYMMTREPLPESYAALARIIGCPIDIIEQNAERILTAYFTHKNGMYFHAKCDEILNDQDTRSKRASAAAKKAAKKRWSQATENNKENAERMPDACEPYAIPMQQDIDRTKTVSKRSIINDTRPIADFIQFYNEMAERVGLTKCQKVSKQRESKLKARIKDCGGMDGWLIALKKVEDSPFLRGETSDRGWKANLDFILQEQSFTKIMEGFYDDKRSKKQPKSPEQELAEFLERGRN